MILRLLVRYCEVLHRQSKENALRAMGYQEKNQQRLREKLKLIRTRRENY